MAIKGDIDAMAVKHYSNAVNDAHHPEFIAELLEWMTCADVLDLMEREDVDMFEWIAGVNALREKLL